MTADKYACEYPNEVSALNHTSQKTVLSLKQGVMNNNE